MPSPAKIPNDSLALACVAGRPEALSSANSVGDEFLVHVARVCSTEAVKTSDLSPGVCWL